MSSLRRKIVIYFFFLVLAVWVLFPLYSVTIFSFMPDPETIAIPTHWIPQQPTMLNYARVLGLAPYKGAILAQAAPFKAGLVNSAIVATATMALAMLISIFAAYAFSRFAFPAKNGLLLTILSSQMVPPAALVIPYYVMFAALNLIGTIQGMVITYLALSIPLATWILIGYFSSLPVDVERQARMDGLGRFGTLFRVVIPMARSGLVSVAAIVFFLSWGEFLFALIITSGSPAQLLAPSMVPLLGLLAALSYPNFSSAATVLALIPVIVLAAIFQSYITRLKIVDPGAIIVEKRPMGV